ncbi:acyltransferase family protein [Algibacter mikhailovii]|uniref:acyltransferase family protein n=1 Tax=Algibacter mikhailovii TaxID=425498 RepID=UPI0024948293|nr:acyltransferase [Algibacter mikhailovii]
MITKPLIPKNLNSNNFDLLRFLLATSVILCHCYAIYYGWEGFAKIEPLMKWSGGKISIGSAAVNFFFVISGFLIVRSFEYSSSFGEYLKKRMLRIYPGFIVAFVLSLFLFGPIGHMTTFTQSAFFDYLNLIPSKRELANMLSLQSPLEAVYFTNLPQSGLNNSLWTIQYEFICYLLVPVLVWLGMTKNKWLLFVVLFLSYAFLCLQSLGYVFQYHQSLSGGVIGNPYYYPRFFTYFLCGSCIYVFRNDIPRSMGLAFISIVLVLLGLKLKLLDVFWPFTTTYLLFYFSYHTKLQFPNFAKHGDLSYGIYLYGWPIQQLVMLYFGKYFNPLTFFVAVLPIVIVFAFFSWKLVEGPALKLKKKRILKVA